MIHLNLISISVRGALGSMLIMNENIGVVLAFTLGTYCDFYVTPVVAIVLIIVFAVSFSFFPESPSYLMKRNREEVSERDFCYCQNESFQLKVNNFFFFKKQAEQSLRFYHDINTKDTDNKLIEFEMNKLKAAFGDFNVEKGANISLTWSDLTTGLGRKALTIGIVLSVLNQFCGCFAMLNYTANIFEEAGSNMKPNVAAIGI